MTKQQDLLNTWAECKRARQSALLEQFTAGVITPDELRAQAQRVSELGTLIITTLDGFVAQGQG